MVHRKSIPLISIVALTLVIGITSLWTQPSSAQVELQTRGGGAIWFFRSCNNTQNDAVASWTVANVTSVPGQKTLKFQVDNAYPGYHLECDLFLANSGRLPFTVKSVNVLNPNPQALQIQAIKDPANPGKTLQPCGFTPYWGKFPTFVPFCCRSKIRLALTLLPEAPENTRLAFTVQVRLEEKPR